MIPFAPNSSTSPMPWEMEGISMGRVTKTENTSRKRRLLRTTHRAKPQAMTMEIPVAAAAAHIEWNSASLKRSDRITSAISEGAMLNSIAASGQITVTNRNIPSSSLTAPEPRNTGKGQRAF